VTEAPSLEPTTAPTAQPTPKPTAQPTPEVVYRIYTVKSGDTLGGIAERFGTTPGAIARLNGITVGSTLHIGQQLKIPN
jgi:putative chitinase